MLRYIRLSRAGVVLLLAVTVLISFFVLPWLYLPDTQTNIGGFTLLAETVVNILRGTQDLSALITIPVVSLSFCIPLASIFALAAAAHYRQRTAALKTSAAKLHGAARVHLDERFSRHILAAGCALLIYYIAFAIQNGQSRGNAADLVGLGFWITLIAMIGFLVLSWELILTIISSIFDFLFRPAQRILGTQRMGYLFVLPNLMIFGIFILIPMLLNFYFGLTTGQSILPENREFVGTQNLQTLFTCESYFPMTRCQEDRFWRAAGNTVIYVAGEIVATVAVALLTALVLNRQIAGRAFFRSVFFYPVLLSPVVVGLIWKWLLHTDYGALNALLVNLGGEARPFLTDAGWAPLWAILVNVWAQMGFYTLILLAGLQSIPAELYEAGAIDGANALAKFRFITLPLLRPTLLVVVVLAVIRAVQVFDHVYVLTGGGPGTATLYMVQYIFQTAFDNRRFGMAAAASLVLACVLLVVTYIQLRVGRRGEALN